MSPYLQRGFKDSKLMDWALHCSTPYCYYEVKGVNKNEGSLAI